MLIADLSIMGITDALAVSYNNEVLEIGHDDAELLNKFITIHEICLSGRDDIVSAVGLYDHSCSLARRFILLSHEREMEDFDFYNSKLLLLYGIRAIITDKGRWLYSCVKHFDTELHFVIADYAKFVYRGALDNLSGSMHFILSDDVWFEEGTFYSYRGNNSHIIIDCTRVRSQTLLASVRKELYRDREGILEVRYGRGRNSRDYS